MQLDLVRYSEAAAVLGLKRPSILSLIVAGTLPPPIKYTPRVVGWPRHEWDAWLASRPRAVIGAAAAAKKGGAT